MSGYLFIYLQNHLSEFGSAQAEVLSGKRQWLQKRSEVGEGLLPHNLSPR